MTKPQRESLKALSRARFNWDRFNDSYFRMDEPARSRELADLEAAKNACRALGLEV